MRAGGSGSKRTCWQREAIVGSSSRGVGASRMKCANGGGLLERLQQAVGGLVVERVRVLQHEHPPARLERRAGRRGDDRLVDVPHQHFPRPRGRDPRQIRVRPARRAPAHLLGSGRPPASSAAAKARATVRLPTPGGPWKR